MRNFLRTLLRDAKSFFFPQTCFLCNAHAENVVCAKCDAILLESEDVFLCTMTVNPELKFLPLADFDTSHRELIHSFKYDHNIEAGIFLSKRLGRKINSLPEFSRFDTIIPVPLHVMRLRERSFNQAQIMAETLARVCNKKMLGNVVSRAKQTKSQTKLTIGERVANVSGAFELQNPAQVQSARILIVDDVITTGATIAEIARLLKNSGALEVCGICAAHPLRERFLP